MNTPCETNSTVSCFGGVEEIAPDGIVAITPLTHMLLVLLFSALLASALVSCARSITSNGVVADYQVTGGYFGHLGTENGVFIGRLFDSPFQVKDVGRCVFFTRERRTINYTLRHLNFKMASWGIRAEQLFRCIESSGSNTVFAQEQVEVPRGRAGDYRLQKRPIMGIGGLGSLLIAKVSPLLPWVWNSQERSIYLGHRIWDIYRRSVPRVCDIKADCDARSIRPKFEGRQNLWFHGDPRPLAQFQFLRGGSSRAFGCISSVDGTNRLDKPHNNQRYACQNQSNIFRVHHAQFIQQDVSSFPKLPIYIILAVILMALGWVGLIFSVYVAIHCKNPTIGLLSALLCIFAFMIGIWLLVGEMPSVRMLPQDKGPWRDGSEASQWQSSIFQVYIKGKAGLVVPPTSSIGIIHAPYKSNRNWIGQTHIGRQFTPACSYRFSRHTQSEGLGEWLIREESVLRKTSLVGHFTDLVLLYSHIVSHGDWNQLRGYQNILSRGMADIFGDKRKIHLDPLVTIGQRSCDQYIDGYPRSVGHFQLSRGGFGGTFGSVRRCFCGIILHHHLPKRFPELPLIFVQSIGGDFSSLLARTGGFSHFSPLQYCYGCDTETSKEACEGDGSLYFLLPIIFLFIGALFCVRALTNLALRDSEDPSLPPFFIAGILGTLTCLYSISYLIAQRYLNRAKANDDCFNKPFNPKRPHAINQLFWGIMPRDETRIPRRPEDWRELQETCNDRIAFGDIKIEKSKNFGTGSATH